MLCCASMPLLRLPASVAYNWGGHWCSSWCTHAKLPPLLQLLPAFCRCRWAGPRLTTAATLCLRDRPTSSFQLTSRCCASCTAKHVQQQRYRPSQIKARLLTGRLLRLHTWQRRWQDQQLRGRHRQLIKIWKQKQQLMQRSTSARQTSCAATAQTLLPPPLGAATTRCWKTSLTPLCLLDRAPQTVMLADAQRVTGTDEKCGTRWPRGRW